MDLITAKQYPDILGTKIVDGKGKIDQITEMFMVRTVGSPS